MVKNKKFARYSAAFCMLGYWILLAVVLFGIATTIPMFMMKDANAANRG